MVMASIGSAIGASVKYDLGVAMFFGRTSFLDPVEITDDAQDYYYALGLAINPLHWYSVWLLFMEMQWENASLKGWKCLHVGNQSGIMLAVLYGPYELIAGKRVGTVAETAIYNGFGRTGWSIALGYIILACCLESGGWVNELLSWPGFVPLAE
ncbi:hypothetical protein EB796_009207 [Bugula neritina]|uniref:Uncharacterized protein n=1 Tax=Bugula neritina TaxID=10212 RepID=A0A7J7K4F8_BUGNE|nr:hypothetical protein EB796_009207 [Bugula neritina]